MFDKNYFLNQLRNGVSMDSMGQALADAMNEAQDAYIAEQEAAKAEQAAQDLAQAKRNLACELIDLIQEYGDLVAPEAANMLDEVNDEDIDAMIETLDQMFNMMVALNELKHNLEKVSTPVKPGCKKPKSDDEVLANFIKSLM